MAMHSRAMLACLLFAALASCATAPPQAPRIERLPEGAAGPIAPLKAGPLTIDEVVQMARAGTPSNVILQKLRDARMNYAIGAQEASAIAARGVPPEVIDFLQHGEPPPVTYAHPTYAYPYSPYPYGLRPWGYPYGTLGRPYPYGHIGSGFYLGFGRRWRR
ncbi:MAG: hypothetical protein V1796_00540 [Pseudomonadota bacterium]